MCRFPRLLMVLGVCVAVAIAAMLGAAPATDAGAATQPARVAASFDRATLNLVPTDLLPGSRISAPTAAVVKSHGEGKAFTGGRMLIAPVAENVEVSLLLPRVEVAMNGDLTEHGPPFRR